MCSGLNIGSIKNPSRIWVLQTHQKIVVEPDFWFRARDLGELNSPEQEFPKFPYTGWSSSWYRLPHDSRIVTRILFTFQQAIKNVIQRLQLVPNVSHAIPHISQTKIMTILAPKALELGFSCFALLRVSRVVWRFGIDLLGPKGFPLCFTKSLTGRRCREQASG